MVFEPVTELPDERTIKHGLSLSRELKDVKAARDREIADILTGKSSKFLLIIGPCSADNEDAVIDYINRLKKVQEKVSDVIVIVPRIYTNKPRTTGEGYKGMAHQPDPGKAPDLSEGIKAIRSLHLRAIREAHLPAADEMLYPDNFRYLDDLLSYVAIGARSVENQQHRLTVSGLDVAVGMKNPTSGDMNVMLNSVKAAQLSHTFVYNGWEVKTRGNDLTHTILRGAVNSQGTAIPNYHYEDLMRLADLYEERDLQNPAVIVDTNHANSDKKHREQPRIAQEILANRRYNPRIQNLVKGLMIESYIEEGSQSIPAKIYGKSITDPCLNWTDSERLILDIADRL